MKLFSPAKLNLFFRVLRKRKDDFHEIASIYGAISLGDFLHLSLSDRDGITCNDPTIPLGDDNLIMKAIHLFRKKSRLFFHVDGNLEKRIPSEAGLGGGSSNAATTLWGLNKLLELPFSQEQLMEMGSVLGSDVPFFFSSGCAYCTGRGEKVDPLPSFPFPSLTIAKPKESLSTPLVYKHTDVGSLSSRNLKRVIESFQLGRPIFFNDLEPAAFRLKPKIASFKEQLLSLGFDQVTMTGSGTAFFCLGNVESPQLEDTSFFQERLITRKKDQWWNLTQLASLENSLMFL